MYCTRKSMKKYYCCGLQVANVESLCGQITASKEAFDSSQWPFRD
jgi:hypothetical protein